jgi:hypothetical protein
LNRREKSAMAKLRRSSRPRKAAKGKSRKGARQAGAARGILADAAAQGPVATQDRYVHIILLPNDVTDIRSAFDRKRELKNRAHGDVMREARRFLQGHPNPAPTDVVVFAGRPWHFANRRLRRHSRAMHHKYKRTVLKVSRTKAERAVWWCEMPFRITGIVNTREGPVRHPFPIPATVEESDRDGNPIYVARAMVHPATADGKRFKISFRIEGQTIDPDMDCTP